MSLSRWLFYILVTVIGPFLTTYWVLEFGMRLAVGARLAYIFGR